MDHILGSLAQQEQDRREFQANMMMASVKLGQTQDQIVRDQAELRNYVQDMMHNQARDQAELRSSIKTIMQTQAQILDRLKSVEETTCRVEAEGLSRKRHEDPRDPDQPEGESRPSKRQRTSSRLAASGSAPQQSTAPPQQPPSSSRKHPVEAAAAPEQSTDAPASQSNVPTSSQPAVFDFDLPAIQTADDDEFEEPASLLPEVQEPEKPFNPEFMRKWARCRIRAPFLEEINEQVFTHQPIPIDWTRVWGFTGKTDEQVKRYFFAIRSIKKEPSSVYTDERIVKVKSIITLRRTGVWYPAFKVERSDHKDWDFTEADLPSLNPLDIDYFYTWFRLQKIRPLDTQIAQRAVIRYMKMRIRLMMIHDLQMALESDQDRVNLLRPKQDMPDPEKHKAFTVISLPDHGVVYVNSSGENRLMRFSELHKYSDGTLKRVRKVLEERQSSHLANPARTHLDNLDLHELTEAIKLIQRKIDLRKGVRRWENYLKYRSDTRWSR